ncbi:MAG: Cna B-type domain-containing protein [Clostridia bacterium]|nr:Cna B-type domain-containing protein [Clostridia bacterium]
MKNIWKKLHILCTVLLLCLSLCALASAVECGLQITLLDEANTPVEGISVEICLVAAGAGEDAVLTADFADAGVDVSALLGTNNADNAVTLYQYLLGKGLSGQTAVTSVAGEVYFTELDAGLYLVFARGGQPMTFLPYLLWLSEGETVTSEPKTEESSDKSLTVFKQWDDNNNADGLRPGMIEVTLLRNGKALRKVSLSAANGWKHTFTDLPNSGTYTVEETEVSGYTPTYTQSADGFVITNYHESDTETETIQVSVKKVWKDADNADGTRPRSVTVQLVQDGTIVQTAVLSADNGWSTSFVGLEAGRSYSVREITVAGYKASYSGSVESGFVITNTHTPATTEPVPDVTTAPTPVTQDPSDPSDPPDTPVTTEPSPDVPDEPDEPDIPKTGANTLPMYILLAVGVLLVLLGTVDLLCKRVKKG